MVPIVTEAPIVPNGPTVQKLPTILTTSLRASIIEIVSGMMAANDHNYIRMKKLANSISEDLIILQEVLRFTGSRGKK